MKIYVFMKTCTNICSSFMGNTQQLEKLNEWIIEQAGTSILWNSAQRTKKWTLSTCNNLDGSQGMYSKYKKSSSKVHIAYYSIYIMFLKWHSYVVQRYSCRGFGRWVMGRCCGCKRVAKVPCHRNILYLNWNIASNKINTLTCKHTEYR